jgi:hypothetical protein
MTYMTGPVSYIYQKAQEVDLGSHTERFIAVVPVINCIFLEMKYAALRHENKPELNKFAATTHYWVWPQIILWAPIIARLQRYLSFTRHTALMIGFSLYILAAEKRTTYIKDLN